MIMIGIIPGNLFQNPEGQQNKELIVLIFILQESIFDTKSKKVFNVIFETLQTDIELQ